MTVPSPTPSPSSSTSTVILPILAVAAPVVALALAWQAFALVFSLAGGTPPSDAERTQSTWLALAACGVAAGLPALGLVLALRTGGRTTIGVFATMLVVGLAFSVVVAVLFGLPAKVDDAITPAPEPASTRSVCQEHSGGDTRCPGG